MMDDLSSRRGFGFDASNRAPGAAGARSKAKTRPAGSGSSQGYQHPQHHHSALGGAEAGVYLHGFYSEPSMSFAVAVDEESPAPRPPAAAGESAVVALEAKVKLLEAAVQQRDTELSTLRTQLASAALLQQHVQYWQQKAQAAEVAHLKAVAAKTVAAASAGASASASSAAGASLESPMPSSKQPVTISPNIFSVTKDRGVQRLKLARCASMGTKRSLMEAEIDSGVMPSDSIAHRIIQGVDNYEQCQGYFASRQFAQDLSYVFPHLLLLLGVRRWVCAVT
jgi:hypothetical protein